MFSQRFVISVLALAAATIPALATTTTYTDPTTFNNATQSLFFNQVDFNTATFLMSTGYTDASGTVFADNGGNNAHLSESPTCANTCAPNGELLDSGSFGFAVTLPSNIYAFAFYVSSPSGSATVSFTGNGHFSTTTLSQVTNPTFFGVVTDAPITGFTINGSSAIIDDFEISSGAAQTAEAGPFLLIGSGLVCLRFLRRRRPAVAAA